MQEIGGRLWYRERRRWPGLALIAWFGFRLVVLGAVALSGRVVPAYPGILRDRDPGADRGPVLYVYHADGKVCSGWRRGIAWGGETFTAVYLPVFPSWHVTTLKQAVTGPRQLLKDVDFQIRLVLYLAGAAGGALLAAYADRIPSLLPKHWSLLPGLERERQRRE
jgi:hypothetical protein